MKLRRQELKDIIGHWQSECYEHAHCHECEKEKFCDGALTQIHGAIDASQEELDKAFHDGFIEGTTSEGGLP